jgi:asparagine synthase (glutamine-hydrolysing)
MLDALSSAPITSIASIYKGMKSAGITVSLDGHGVDEMMYGYKNMVATLYQYYLWNGNHHDALTAGETLVNMYHPVDQNKGWDKIKEQLKAKRERENSFIYRFKQLLPAKSRFDRDFIPVKLPALGKTYDFSGHPLDNRMLLYETFQHTLPALFRNFDRASMMNGVEIRMPFMDYRIVEFLFSLPPEYKFGSGKTKLLLREAMKNHLPPAIRDRTFKVGIASPAEAWFNGLLHEWLMDQTQSMPVRVALEKDKKVTGKISKQMVMKAWKEVNLKLIST